MLISGRSELNFAGLSSGGTSAGADVLPLSALQEFLNGVDLANVWRTTRRGIGGTAWVQATWPIGISLRVVALVAHNLPRGATVSLDVYTGAVPGAPGATISWTSGALAEVPRIWVDGAVPYMCWVLPFLSGVRAVRLNYSLNGVDASYRPATVDAGHWWAGDALEVLGYEAVDIQLLQDASMDRTRTGQIIASAGQVRRRIRWMFSDVSALSAIGVTAPNQTAIVSLQDIAQGGGGFGSVLVLPMRLASAARVNQHAVLGELSVLELSKAEGDLYGCVLEVEEI